METKRLAICSTIQQAYMLRDILMNEGINCILTNEAQSMLYPGLNFTSPEIWVEEEYYDEAYAIYQDVINGQADIE